MNKRQRFVAALRFEPVDRVPFDPGEGRESTRAAWRTQGLPPDVTDHVGYVCKLIGIERQEETRFESPGVVLTMRPEFEEKIIEEREDSRIVQDWKGNVCEIGKQFDPSYLRGAPDFVTRSWLRCPVESRGDWPDMARRYDPDDPARFPDDWADRCATLRVRTHESGLMFPGPFWQLREWLGFENLCMLLLDDPDFAAEMIGFWQQFIATMFEKMFADYVPDFIVVNEDMAYKEKPMIGPEMARRFLLPCWRQWGEICRGAGVPVYGVDSDGHVGQLIPVWLEAGFNWNLPVEVAAGNDLPAYRQQYGEQIAWYGGIDKRAMAKGGNALRNEIERNRPTIDAGGYIPSCDHGIPADVPWPHYVEYCRLLAQATGWL